ncbi:MAG: DNA polymerase III, subunit gamma and tau [Candidatus Vogelbacteria bacterium RIFOXYD2_FULL_44_9]|uniref:DNA polymerase III subunit gamma/tau n=1 Tax=Candidatus Vogelbacteria bacterium RIFOXYD2_FULL_44_9 TaxID=1802441 RepID=A0A1G2QPZ5_9BACT|nr:MAG: DNA polymerase III, subunit gamma and tau [Candidatus Vogelbacteria bacterium RIFOXYD2_FULL_44_9]
MSEIALYRKYRPAKFNEVVGQEPIVKALEGSIASSQVAHAYLFAGPRGTGKTSIARIFAEELGCTGNDLYEIDGASNNGVGEIRELREAVGSLPFSSPYKVYIIDEVHMLSNAAFNALLKTLEEPPRHVIFILATTELHKVPETVVSRCQTFRFHQPEIPTLQKHIKDVVKKEGYSIDEKSSHLIALLSEGSFRDALGTLQKVMVSSGDKKLTIGEVEKITGAPKRELIKDFLLGLITADADRALTTIANLSRDGVEAKVMLRLALEELRRGMLAGYAPELLGDNYLAVDEDELAFYQELASHDNAKFLSAILRELLTAYAETGLATIQSLPVELAIISIVKQIKLSTQNEEK